nr:Chain C, Peptide [synthetic construct]
DVAIDMM